MSVLLKEQNRSEWQRTRTKVKVVEVVDKGVRDCADVFGVVLAQTLVRVGTVGSRYSRYGWKGGTGRVVDKGTVDLAVAVRCDRKEVCASMCSEQVLPVATPRWVDWLEVAIEVDNGDIDWDD